MAELNDEGFLVRTFQALTLQELHDLLALRVAIFVVEQRCAYQEIDGRDPDSIHVLAKDDHGQVIACARVIPPRGDEPPRIGRVAVRMDHRGKGLAHGLVRQCLREVRERYGPVGCQLSAQATLQAFYAAHGFEPVSEVYDWDGIPHIDMRLSATR